MVNKTNVQRVIDALNYEKYYSMPFKEVKDLIDSEEIIGFNMDTWLTRRCSDRSNLGCGTTACIGGHITILSTGKKEAGYLIEEDVIEETITFLDISKGQAERLLGVSNTGIPSILTLVTVEEAIKTLENLRDSGRVSWQHVIKRERSAY